MAISRRIVLHFPRHLVDQPVVYRLVKDYDLEFNILKASVTPEEGGLLILELSGEQDAYDHGVRYLSDVGVEIQPLSQDVIRNEARCTHCGACVTVCPTGAFALELPSRRVNFYADKCIACGFCIKLCPPRAMEVHF